MVSDNLLTQKKKISKCRVVRRPLFLPTLPDILTERVTREGVQEDRGAVTTSDRHSDRHTVFEHAAGWP